MRGQARLGAGEDSHGFTGHVGKSGGVLILLFLQSHLAKSRFPPTHFSHSLAVVANSTDSSPKHTISRLKTGVVILSLPIRLPTPLKGGTLSLFRAEKGEV